MPIVSAPKTESGAGSPYNVVALRTPIHKHFVGMIIENTVTHLLVKSIGIVKRITDYLIARRPAHAFANLFHHLVEGSIIFWIGIPF